jgi:hypothetical protein
MISKGNNIMILRKRRVSGKLTAEEEQGMKSSMHRKQGTGAQFSVQSWIQQNGQLSFFEQVVNGHKL